MSERAWRVAHHEGTAASLHDLEPTADHDRQVWVCEVVRPALVLGSAQDDRTVRLDHLARHGIDLVRRRSGGGAVLLVPGEATWVDVVVARTSELVVDDVSRSFDWLGEAWVRALGELGVAATRHDGPLQRSAWSGTVCFAGLGPGEVLVDGCKVVGLAQRRTRTVVRFQCVVHHVWRPAELLACFALDEHERAAAVAGIRAAALAVDATELEDALLAHLPA